MVVNKRNSRYSQTKSVLIFDGFKSATRHAESPHSGRMKL